MTVYGPKIYSSEINPTYIGEAEISSWSSGVVLDRLTNAPLSTAYNYADFESLAILTGNISDMVRQECAAQDLESRRKKVVGEPYEGKPHARFEVAGDGNRDMEWVIEALPEETGSKQAAQPKF